MGSVTRFFAKLGTAGFSIEAAGELDGVAYHCLDAFGRRAKGAGNCALVVARATAGIRSGLNNLFIFSKL